MAKEELFRTTYFVKYKSGRIFIQDKATKRGKQFSRNISFSSFFNWVVSPAFRLLGCRVLSEGVTGSSLESEGDRAGWSVLNKGLITGYSRSEYAIIETDTELEALITKEGGATEVGNFIFPYLVSRGISKGVEQPVENKLPVKNSNYSAETGKETFFVRNDTGHSWHYIQKHCYASLRSYGDEIAKVGQFEVVEDEKTKKKGMGTKWSVSFTRKVTWVMDILWSAERIKNTGTLFENVDSGSDLAQVMKFVAQTATSVAVAASSGGAVPPTPSPITRKPPSPSNYNMQVLQAKQEYLDSNQQNMIDKIMAGKGSDEAKQKTVSGMLERSSFAKRRDTVIAEAKDRVAYEKTMKSYEDQLARDEISLQSQTDMMAFKAEITRDKNRKSNIESAGKAFSGLSRLMHGGHGSYSSSIQEFMAHKSPQSLLEVYVKTGREADNIWRAKLNKHIHDWYFPFGDDEEITMKKGFGWDVGKGHDILKDLHGWVKLSSRMELMESMPNKLFEVWTENDIFIYQPCCGEANAQNGWKHSVDCRRPRWKEDGSSFYPGFSTNLTINLMNRPAENYSFDVTDVDTIGGKTTAPNPAIVFHFAWCGNETRNWNFQTQGNFVVSEPASQSKSRVEIKVKNEGVGYGDNWESSSAPGWALGKKYVKIHFSNTREGESYTFGEGGSEYRYLCLGFNMLNPYEECWMDRGEGKGRWTFTRTSGSNSRIEITGHTEEKQIGRKSTISFGTNALNVTLEVPLRGLSGMESWGDNPPDGFTSGGSGGLGSWISNVPETDPVGGMLLPTVDQLKSTEAEDLNLKDTLANMEGYAATPELPDRIKIPTAEQIADPMGLGTGVGEGERRGLHDETGIRGSTGKEGTKTPAEKQKEEAK
jgi:hypothetical protein